MYQLNDCGYRKSHLLYQDTEKLVFPANMILAACLRLLLRRNMSNADCRNCGVEGKMLGLDSTVLLKAHEGNTRLNNKLHCKNARKCPATAKVGQAIRDSSQHAVAG
jgi:hypothetical protein